MLLALVKSKIHRATITGKALHYEGSLGVDGSLLAASNTLPYEKVQVVNVNNGERFETYVIPLTTGKGEVILNGAAARKGEVGDKIIIITYCQLSEEEAKRHHPTFLFLNEKNALQSQ